MDGCIRAPALSLSPFGRLVSSQFRKGFERVENPGLMRQPFSFSQRNCDKKGLAY